MQTHHKLGFEENSINQEDITLILIAHGKGDDGKGREKEEAR